MDGRLVLTAERDVTAFTLELPATAPTVTAREARGRGRRRGARPGGRRLQLRRRRRPGRRLRRAEQGHDHAGPGGRGPRQGAAARSTRPRSTTGSSPGVVTILSIFDGGGSLLEDGGEGGQGSGFVVDGDGYIATNAHVVTTERRDGTARADEVYVEFSDGNRVPADIVGDDPNADVALLKVDPAGLSLTPLRLGHSALARGRRAGRGDRQPVRRAPVAVDRRDLGARPDDPVAHAASRSATRSRRTPRSTPATPAGRCSTRRGG